MTPDTTTQGLHHQVPPEVKGVIDELLEERGRVEKEALDLALSSPRAAFQRIADWNRRAEEALQR